MLCRQRVQNSVFECLLDNAQYEQVKHQLIGLIDEKKDSLRFYKLGNNYAGKIEHVGAKTSYPAEGTLIF